jgi:carbamoyl-phosphate synthase large subunit
MIKPLTIGISGINATDNPGPGVAVARSIKEKNPDIQLVGLSYDVHDPGNYLTDLFINSFLLPYPTHGWDKFEKALDEVIAKTGMNVLIPCLDAELPLLIRHQKDLEKKGVRVFLPTEEQFELRSKDKLVELSLEMNCRYPKTSVVYSIPEMLTSIRDNFSLPVVVKGKYYKAYIVYNYDTAVMKASEIAAEWGFPILIQEQVTGPEINLIGLADGQGKLLGHVAIKKQLTTHLGKVWTAVTIQDDELEKLARRFCETTKWRGPFELECMKGSDGIYMIEINPRFPAWVYFATAVGVNLPAQLIELITTGKCKTEPSYLPGKFLVRQTSEFVTDLSYFQNLLSKNNREGI